MKNHDENSEFDFCENLNKRLKGQNLSKISRKLDIPKTLLHDWSSSKRQPAFKNIPHLKKLSDHFGISLEEFILGKKPAHSILSSIVFKDDAKSYRIKIEKLE